MRAFILLALLGLCSAFNITELDANVLVSTEFPVVETEALMIKDYLFFKFLVPENVKTLQLTVSSGCDVLLYTSGINLPCTTNEYNTSILQPCAGAFQSTLGTGDAVVDVYKGTDGSDSANMFIRLGEYVYFTLVRDDTVEPNVTCALNVTATATNCSSGEVGYQNTTLTTLCTANYTKVSGTDGTYVLDIPAIPAGRLFSWRVLIPPQTGSITLTGILTSASIPTVYVGFGRVPDTFFYDVAITNDSSVGADAFYNTTIYDPPWGYMYLSLKNSIVSGNINITANVCDDGLGGLRCSYPVLDVTGLVQADDTVYINITEASPFGSALYYLSLEITEESDSTWDFTFTANNGSSVHVVYTFNGYGDDSDTIYILDSYIKELTVDEPLEAGIGPYELVPGRHIFGIVNTGDVGVTISASYTLNTTGVTTSTTDTTTTGEPSVDGGLQATGIATLVVFTVVMVGLVVGVIVGVSLASPSVVTGSYARLALSETGASSKQDYPKRKRTQNLTGY